jgi:hypothetical protein
MVFNSEWAGGRSLMHGGSNGYNYSMALLSPNKRFGIIATTNMGPGTMADPLDPVVGRLLQFHSNLKLISK